MQKKSLFVLSGVAVSVLVLSTQGESHAAPASNLPPTGPAPTVIARPQIDFPPSVSGFHFLGGSATKANPPATLKGFALEVPIRVSGTSPRTGVLHVKNQGASQVNAPFTIASGETKTIPVVDSIGLANACAPAHYDIELEGSGFDVKKTGTVTASCTFTSKSGNPWNLAVPDRVEERKANHVYFDDATAAFYHVGSSASPTVPSAMVNACGSKLVFKTNVTNNLKHAVSGLRLTITVAGVVKGMSVPFSLAAGKSSSETVETTFAGEAGDYTLVLTDPNNTALGAVSYSGYHVDVARTCSLTSALDP